MLVLDRECLIYLSWPLPLALLCFIVTFATWRQLVLPLIFVIIINDILFIPQGCLAKLLYTCQLYPGVCRVLRDYLSFSWNLLSGANWFGFVARAQRLPPKMLIRGMSWIFISIAVVYYCVIWIWPWGVFLKPSKTRLLQRSLNDLILGGLVWIF